MAQGYGAEMVKKGIRKPGTSDDLQIKVVYLRNEV
jgi:hypothetical protein